VIPRQPENNTNLPRANKQELIAQAIDQHADGMSLRQIAEQIGVSHQAIRKWLLTAGDQYKQAQISGLTQRIIEADEMLESATDAVGIARAREIARYARWDAERRLPHLFGPKVEQTGGISVNVVINNPLESVSSVPKRAAPSAIIDNESGEVEVSE
jgi:transcriptional regulator with XRE-family HTH domain